MKLNVQLLSLATIAAAASKIAAQTNAQFTGFEGNYGCSTAGGNTAIVFNVKVHYKVCSLNPILSNLLTENIDQDNPYTMPGIGSAYIDFVPSNCAVVFCFAGQSCVNNDDISGTQGSCVEAVINDDISGTQGSCVEATRIPSL